MANLLPVEWSGAVSGGADFHPMFPPDIWAQSFQAPINVTEAGRRIYRPAAITSQSAIVFAC